MKKMIEYTITKSLLGLVLIATSEKGVCAILMDDKASALIEDLQYRFPETTLEKNDKALLSLARKIVKHIENPARVSDEALDIALDIRGTEFQKRVWNSLRKIPVGQTASYTEIAKKLKNPGAIRAVASACAANAIAVLIPCHRVVRSDGKLSGYRWGIERKQTLLELERRYESAH